MSRFILRRTLLSVPILFGVMLLTFVLFFLVQTPETMAKRALGQKANSQEIQNWLHQRGYDRPLFLNTQPGKSLLDSQFFGHLKSLALFDFGCSDLNGEPVAEKFKRGVLPSLCITFPAFLIGLWTAVCAALFLVFIRESLLDTLGTILCVVSMSLPPMVYIIFGHWVGAVVLKYFPAYGFSSAGWDMGRFLVLPVMVMALCGVGGDIRLYRSIFLEHSRQDYVRTAHAKGLSFAAVFLKHILKNGAIAMVTLVVSSLPFLIMGSLLIEDFFGIPGLGGLSIDSIRTADFAQLRAVVYFGSLLYLAGITLADICYAWVDPRIRLR